MIQPTDTNQLQNRNLMTNKLTIYYIIALSLSALNFAPIINRDINSAWNSYYQKEKIPKSLSYWFLSSFVLSIPLILEFILDTFASKMHSTYYLNVLDHRFGQALLLFSLSLPVVLLFDIPSDHDTLLCRCLLSFCESLAISAIFGKLQVFSQGRCWKAWNSCLVITLFLVAQVSLNFESEEMSSFSGLLISFMLAMARLMLVLWFAREHLTEMLSLLRNRKFHATVTANKYKSFVLLVLMFVYLIARLLLLVYFMFTSGPDLEQTVVVRLSLLIIISVGGCVLPGRMFRRGVVVLKVSFDFLHFY